MNRNTIVSEGVLLLSGLELLNAFCVSRRITLLWGFCVSNINHFTVFKSLEYFPEKGSDILWLFQLVHSSDDLCSEWDGKISLRATFFLYDKRVKYFCENCCVCMRERCITVPFFWRQWARAGRTQRLEKPACFSSRGAPFKGREPGTCSGSSPTCFGAHRAKFIPEKHMKVSLAHFPSVFPISAYSYSGSATPCFATRPGVLLGFSPQTENWG